MKETVGLVGVGNMGAPIARRLLDAGYRLRVYNRTAARADALVAAGAERAETPAAAAPRGGIVFSIVADDAALAAVCEGANGIPAGLGAGGAHVSMSTVGAATAREMEERHAAVGVAYLCAPVFGRPPAAAAGALWVALSGPPDARARVAPALAAFAAGVREFGAAPGAANVVKLANNFLIGAAIEAVAEACALTEKHGVDRAAFVELIAGSLFDCPVYRIYGEAVAERRYEPAGFRLALGLKDISLALDAAGARSVPMPVASVVRDRLLSALADGRADQDWTALDAAVSAAAGLAAPGPERPLALRRAVADSDGGRPVADGSLANPVRSGRKQP